MTGMPPATAASKLRATPFFSASRASSTPCLASSALLAVTTCLPAPSAASTASLATPSSPPISSTNTSIGLGGQRHGIVEPLDAVERDATLLGARARRDAHDLDAAADIAGEPVSVLCQQLQQTRAHRAEAGDAQFQRLIHRAAT